MKKTELTTFDWKWARNIWTRSMPELKPKGKNLSEQLFNVITSGRYRRGRRYQMGNGAFDKESIMKIQNSISHGKPIEIILPAFPFKFTHPLKTGSVGADMSEIVSLSKLHELCTQVKRVYPKGLKISIIRDGALYADVFSRSATSAQQYGLDLHRFVKLMGLEDEISFLDLRSTLHSQPDFRQKYQQAASVVDEILKDPKSLRETVQALRGSAAANLPTTGIPHGTIERIFSLEEKELNLNEILLKRNIEHRAENAARDYLILNKTIELLDLYNRVQPTALRGSAHLGEGKIPLQLTRKKTQLFPWMGVSVQDSKGFTVRYSCEVANNSAYTPVYLKGNSTPLYYKKV
jgi:pyoverdine/dityrosine biosynthesis protein Dit1